MSKARVIVGGSERLTGILVVSEKPLEEVAKSFGAVHRRVDDRDFFLQDGGVEYSDEELSRCVQDCEMPKFAWMIYVADLKFDADLEDVVIW